VDNAVQKLFYSGKHKRHCVKYECGVRRDGLICWINGPHQGAKADVTVYREQRMEDHLDLGERILGDKGYFGEKRIITPRKKRPGKELTTEELAFNGIVSSHRIEVEHTFGKIKVFRALSSPWRQALKRHKKVFFILCEITNLKEYQ